MKFILTVQITARRIQQKCKKCGQIMEVPKPQDRTILPQYSGSTESNRTPQPIRSSCFYNQLLKPRPGTA